MDILDIYIYGYMDTRSTGNLQPFWTDLASKKSKAAEPQLLSDVGICF